MASAKQLVRHEDQVCRYCGASKRCNARASGGGVVITKPKPVANTSDSHQLWHWEGNIQARLVSWLVQQGWSIRSAADTASKAAGKV